MRWKATVSQETAVMDIGSSKITVMVGHRGVNNTICLLGTGESEYAGYEDGEWYQPDELVNAVERAISHAQSDSHTKIRHLYIGVPGQFTVTQCKNVTYALNRRRKITDEDVNELHNIGDTYSSDPNYLLVNSQPIYYTLGDDRMLIQPVGLTSNKLTGYISYILAEKTFINFFKQIMEELGIESYEFVSSVLAESLFLLDDMVRDRYAVLMDIGYIVTDVIVTRGDGLLKQFSIPMGGGHISKDLKDDLGIRYSLAEMLKRKIVLNLEFGENETYDLTVKQRKMSFPAKQVNEIVQARLSKLSRIVNNCLVSSSLPSTTTYYMTGGGISYMTGARDYLSKKLDKHIELAVPKLPQYNKPHLSSILGLMDMVLESKEEPIKRKGFWARLFGR